MGTKIRALTHEDQLQQGPESRPSERGSSFLEED